MSFLQRLCYWLPNDIVCYCAIRVVAEATTGKYSDTVVPELSAIDAVQRFARIHALGGAGSDQHWDSNRNRK